MLEQHTRTLINERGRYDRDDRDVRRFAFDLGEEQRKENYRRPKQSVRRQTRRDQLKKRLRKAGEKRVVLKDVLVAAARIEKQGRQRRKNGEDGRARLREDRQLKFAHKFLPLFRRASRKTPSAYSGRKGRFRRPCRSSTAMFCRCKQCCLCRQTTIPRRMSRARCRDL